MSRHTHADWQTTATLRSYNRNTDFRFADFARRSGDRCVAVRELPEYDIAAISTGQYTEDGRLWEGEYRFER